MKRLLVALTLVLVAGCDDGFIIAGDDAVDGSGTIITETRDVSDFDGVIIQGSGVVTIDVTGAASLAITADDNLLPLLTSEVQEQTLELSIEEDTSIDPSEPIRYDITVPTFGGISVVGSADVVVTNVDSVSVAIAIAGSGDVVLSGSAGDLAVDIRGSGNIDAEGLEVRTSGIDIAGSGDVVVNASEELLVTISGSGDVRYLGSPRVEQTVSGSGSVSSR